MSAWHSPRRLAGMAAPLVAWALHFVLLYSLQGLACARGWQHPGPLGLSVLAWTWLGLTALALALIGWLGLRAWRSQLAAGLTGEGDVRQRQAYFASRLTLLVSALAFVAVVFTVVPVFLLPVCD